MCIVTIFLVMIFSSSKCMFIHCTFLVGKVFYKSLSNPDLCVYPTYCMHFAYNWHACHEVNNIVVLMSSCRISLLGVALLGFRVATNNRCEYVWAVSMW